MKKHNMHLNFKVHNAPVFRGTPEGLGRVTSGAVLEGYVEGVPVVKATVK